MSDNLKKVLILEDKLGEYLENNNLDIYNIDRESEEYVKIKDELARLINHLNNKELTNQVLIRDSKGTLWYDTKDYGYVDKTGTLFVLDRYQEPVNINSLSIQLIDIAEKVKQCEVVKLCKVNYTNGKMIFQVSFDEFSKKTKEECEQELIDYINNNFKDFEKPDILSIQDSLPRTPVGKVDYQKLNENAKLFSKEAIDGVKIKVLKR